MKKQSNIHPLFEQILDAVRPVNAARIKAEKKMNKLKKIDIEIKQIVKT
jgi:hypothetical protein